MSAALLIYDGDCGFCTTAANWFASKAGSSASISPWQVLDLDALGLTQDQVSSASWFRSADDHLHHGADGFAAAMRTVPSWWKMTGHLLSLPGVIHVARALYPVIARNRHRLPGATNACKITLD